MNFNTFVPTNAHINLGFSDILNMFILIGNKAVIEQCIYSGVETRPFHFRILGLIDNEIDRMQLVAKNDLGYSPSDVALCDAKVRNEETYAKLLTLPYKDEVLWTSRYQWYCKKPVYDSAFCLNFDLNICYDDNHVNCWNVNNIYFKIHLKNHWKFIWFHCFFGKICWYSTREAVISLCVCILEFYLSRKLKLHRVVLKLVQRNYKREINLAHQYLNIFPLIRSVQLCYMEHDLKFMKHPCIWMRIMSHSVLKPCL